MPETCETVKVKTDAVDNPDGFYLINKSDFNPDVHALLGAAAGDHDAKPSDGLKVEEIKALLEAKGIAIPDGAKKAPTVPEIKATLEAAGVTVPDGAKKADLVALLNAFERSGLSGAEWNNLAEEDRANRVSY